MLLGAGPPALPRDETHIFLLCAHILAAIVTLLGPGGVRALVAENLLPRRQLLTPGRSRQRAPNFPALDRLSLDVGSFVLPPRRLGRAAVIVRASAPLGFHRALMRRKHRLLYSSKRKGTPGPEGPSPGLIQLILEMKRRNPADLGNFAWLSHCRGMFRTPVAA